MITFLTWVHIITIIILVTAVLLQSGKGAEVSASFGGSSQTVFGSSGGANFFQKLTYTLAAIFMMTSLTLTILPSKVKKSVFEGYTPPPAAATDAKATTTETAPAEKTAAPTNAANEKAAAPAGTTASESKKK